MSGALVTNASQQIFSFKSTRVFPRGVGVSRQIARQRARSERTNYWLVMKANKQSEIRNFFERFVYTREIKRPGKISQIPKHFTWDRPERRIPFYLPVGITGDLQMSAKSRKKKRRSALLVSVKPTQRAAHSWLEHAEKSPVRSSHKCARGGLGVGVACISVPASYYGICAQESIYEVQLRRRILCTRTCTETYAGARGRSRGQNAVNGA